jgi:predicted dehydrogenase
MVNRAPRPSRGAEAPSARGALSRRRALGIGGAVVAGGALTLGPSRRALGANERIHLGFIGCGGITRAHLEALQKVPAFDVVAACDVDAKRLGDLAAKAEQQYGRRPAELRDFRKLLELKEVDAVVVATPDHWHGLCLIHACQAGKDVYVEKPLSHSLREGRAMVKAALAARRVVQVGTQQRSAAHYQEAIALIRRGELGRVVEAQTWNHYNRAGMGAPPDGPPPPEVDYDLWLGPAPRRPFNPKRYHGSWRHFRDYGGGYVTDWNTHHQDIVHLALDVWAPVAVSMAGFVSNTDDIRDMPDTAHVVFEYAAPQGRFVSTYSVRVQNALASDFTHARSDHGIAFFGQKGTLVIDRGGFEILPEGAGGPRGRDSAFGDQKEVKATRPEASRRVAGRTSMIPHFEDFAACIKSRGKPRSDIETMHRSTAVNQVANIAWRVGRRLHFDAKTETLFADAALARPDAEANKLLFREPRAPWKIPPG